MPFSERLKYSGLFCRVFNTLLVVVCITAANSAAVYVFPNSNKWLYCLQMFNINILPPFLLWL